MCVGVCVCVHELECVCCERACVRESVRVDVGVGVIW